jgi:hypothetical protein
MDDDIPVEITGNLHTRIRVGLLRIDATRQEPRRSKRPGAVQLLVDVFDLYAGQLLQAERMTEELLTETIPRWVIRWAKPRGLLQTMRQVNAARPVRFVFPGFRKEVWTATEPVFEPIPDVALLRAVQKLLEGRIAHWRAEWVEHDCPPARIARVRTRHPKMSTEDIAKFCNVSRTVLFDWQAGRPVGAASADSINTGIDTLLTRTPPGYRPGRS